MKVPASAEPWEAQVQKDNQLADIKELDSKIYDIDGKIFTRRGNDSLSGIDKIVFDGDSPYTDFS